MIYDKSPLIIAGIPHLSERTMRSVLTECGFALGRPAAEPSSLDSVEDQSPFITLHDEMLEQQGADDLIRSIPSGSRVQTRFGAEAKEMLGRFYGNGRPWGWVDARTTLLLDFWDNLIAEARWIFLFCRPSLFAWSLIADDRLREHSRLPVKQAFEAFSVWRSYSSKLLEFVADRQDRSFLLEVPAGLERAAPSLNDTLTTWGYTFDPIDPSALYQPNLYIERTPDWVVRSEAASVKTRLVWRSLRDLALQQDGAGAVPVVRPASARASIGDDGRHRVCVAGWNRDAYSQTFVRAHIERLPAPTTVLVKRGSRFVTQDEFRIGTPLERATAALLREFRADPRNIDARSLSRFLKRQRLDAVLAEFGPTGVMLWRACRMAGVPLVVHFHGYDAYRTQTLEEHGAEYAEMFDNVAAIIVVSSEMQRQLVSLGASPELVHCNPCGVDIADFSQADPKSAPPTFLAVGRFVNKKGPLLTILAFRQVVHEVPEARLLMVGEGELLDGSRQIVDGLGLEDCVHFLGSRTHREVAGLMRSVRAFVQHSVVAEDRDSEGTPVAVLEAGATGIPVVCTRHAGIADSVVHAETGYLVDERDVSSMADYMKKLARNPGLASAMGARAREHVSRNHSMDLHLQRLWEIIERVIDADENAEASVGTPT